MEQVVTRGGGGWVECDKPKCGTRNFFQDIQRAKARRPFIPTAI
jgi:hypothetical protein